MKSPVDILLWRGSAVLAAAATLSLAGCSVQNASKNTSPVALASISGTVHGGQQPVSNARVYLFAVTQGGYGAQANSILNNPGYVVTTSGGGFNITGDYTCPSNSQVYLAATGGNPGLAAGSNNASITLLAGLGSCSALSASTNVTINEVSTAAMAYAMSSFMSNYTQAAVSGTNVTGVARAMASIPNMINVASGTVLATTPGGNGAVPVAEINTLANVIAACVNSNGSDGQCASLFAATTPAGGTAPNDTFSALLSIAQNPASKVSQIFNLSSANAPFQPSLASAPNDWSVAINYTGGGLSQPYGIAIDISGDIWVTNPGANTVSHLNYLGVPYGAALTGNGLSGPRGIASDLQGNIYASNFTNNTITRISNAGIPSTLTGGGLNQPFDLAIDGNNDVYTANQGNASISHFYSNGAAANGAGYAGGGVNVPTSIAIGPGGIIWTANSGNSSLSKFAPATNVYQSPATGYTGGGLLNPTGIGFDASGNAIGPNANDTVYRFINNGTPTGVSPYSGGGTGTQGGIAVDGDGTFFVTETSGNALKVLLNSGGTPKAPAPGITASSLNGPAKVRIDSAGNVWVTNNGTGAASLTEFIGLGAPTATPLAAAAANGTQGKRP